MQRREPGFSVPFRVIAAAEPVKRKGQKHE